jgi:hypothetical protein
MISLKSREAELEVSLKEGNWGDLNPPATGDRTSLNIF